MPFAQLRSTLSPSRPGSNDVEDHASKESVVRVRTPPLPVRETVNGLQNSLLQPGADEAGDLRLVFDDEDAHESERGSPRITQRIDPFSGIARSGPGISFPPARTTKEPSGLA